MFSFHVIEDAVSQIIFIGLDAKARACRGGATSSICGWFGRLGRVGNTISLDLGRPGFDISPIILDGLIGNARMHAKTSNENTKPKHQTKTSNENIAYFRVSAEIVIIGDPFFSRKKDYKNE